MRRSLSRRPRRPLAERPGILPDVTAAVGATPLVALDRIAAGVAPRLVGKLEHLNPGGSVKDRIALPMIEAAERAGLLKPGGVIVEPTSGNTGVGLAQAAAVKGYRCIFVMADEQSEEKRALLRAYGAEVVICPSDVGPDDERSYYRVSDRLLRETPGAWKPDQYTNPANPEAHYVTTGPEIWEATDGRVTHFVVALGTDYNMLVAARLREEMESGRPVKEAVASAVRHTAPAIGAAGLVLATAFGSLMLYPDIATREMGFATALGILLAALLVSTLLVPALTALIGRRAFRKPERADAHAERPLAA